MSFGDSVDEARKDMGSDSDFYKLQEGDNKLHILTEPQIEVSRFGFGICYEGAPYCQKETLDKDYEDAQAKAKAEGKDPSKVARPRLGKKWWCWAIDRKTNKFVILRLPYKVSKTLLEMMTSDEAGFKGWPMPYGINIKAKHAGTMDAEYEVIGSRQNTDITDEETEELAKQTPIETILDRMKAKQKAKTEGTAVAPGTPTDYPQEDINPDDIPF